MTETKTIEIRVYRDKEGKPICAKNFKTGEFCKYLGSRRMGTQEVCMFGENQDLFRQTITSGEFKGEQDYVRPHKNCPLWAEELKND